MRAGRAAAPSTARSLSASGPPSAPPMRRPRSRASWWSEWPISTHSSAACRRPSCTCTWKAASRRSCCWSWRRATACARAGTPPEALRAAYEFDNLQSFLDLYYEGCRVLVQERDFYDITRAYLRRAHADAVVRAEVFIGPQGFTERDVPIAAVMDGVLAAMRDAAREDGISAGLLVSAQRHRSEAEALQMLDQVMPWADQIAGFGLGGAELGNPPSRFVNFFRACRERGFRVTAHAGEEGPASYVREAVELLEVDRIDHGNACLDDPALVRELAARAIPLTVCPLSNVRLKVVPSLAAHPLPRHAGRRPVRHAELRRSGVFRRLSSTTISSSAGRLSGLSADECVTLARNSLTASFVRTGGGGAPRRAARRLRRCTIRVRLLKEADDPSPSARCAARPRAAVRRRRWAAACRRMTLDIEQRLPGHGELHRRAERLSRPDLVREIHRGYFEAGADMVETNTLRRLAGHARRVRPRRPRVRDQQARRRTGARGGRAVRRRPAPLRDRQRRTRHQAADPRQHRLRPAGGGAGRSSAAA